ncbi:hypothetical protein [Lewinella sp. 4G2]|uniref:hypothetical protein n=1 Tax=Lewinella sp. 4G2 TaxID=1803372 RepID=UPI0007B4BF28|nr:hypothetical protein [Lewinella sp. 4G2]OAV44610.1 hypothetical protein A3850_008945 [Lewinella sp. 4G2]
MFDRARSAIHECIYTLLAFPRAWRFMWHNQLWVGLRQYGWVARGLLFFAVILGIYMISEAVDFYSDHRNDAVQALFMSEDSLFLRLGRDAYDSLSEGSLKWVILILMEVVIYHFMRRTLAIVLNKQIEDAHTFKPFYHAQIRMIAVSVIALTVESVTLGILGSLSLGPAYWPLSVLVSSAFLGFVIADNYNEQFNLSISQSMRDLSRNYVGICIGLGLPLFFMLKVPFLGALVGPLVTSVTAAIVLRERSDLHIIGYQMSESEAKSAAKKEARAARKAARKLKRKRKRSSVSA